MNIKHFHIDTFYSSNNIDRKKVTNKEPPVEKDISKKDYDRCKKYLEERKIDIIKGLIEPTIVEFSGKYGKYKKPYIAMRYPNGFTKFRSIDKDCPKSSRFISFGADGYKEFFNIRENGTDTLFLTEGELEGLSLINYTDNDIKAMHNLNSIPNTVSLKKYKRIEVLIDYDKFYNVNLELYCKIKKICNSDTEITIRPKLIICFDGKFDTNLDYNEFLKQGTLNTCLVETGRLSEFDIPNKDMVDRFDFLLPIDFVRDCYRHF